MSNNSPSKGSIMDIENLTLEEFRQHLQANMDIIENSGLPEESLEKIRKLYKAVQSGDIAGIDQNEFLALLSDVGETLAKAQEDAAQANEGQSSSEQSDDERRDGDDRDENMESELNETRRTLLQRCNDLQALLNQMISVHKSMLAKDTKITDLDKKHRQFVQDLAESFSVKPSDDAQKLATDIRASITQSKLLKNLIQRFSLPEYTTEDSVLEMLDTKANTENLMKEAQRLTAQMRQQEDRTQQYYGLTDEKTQLQNDLKAAEAQIQKLKDQKEKLLKRVETAENNEKELRAEHQSLQEKFHQTSIRADVAENEVEALKESLEKFRAAISLPKEESRQSEAVATLAEQLQQQMYELEDSHQTINKLTEIIQKQSQTLALYEKKLQEALAKPTAQGKQFSDSFLSDILVKLSEGCQYQVVEDAARIAETKQPFEIKLVQVLQCFINEIDRLTGELHKAQEETPLTNIEQQLLAMLENQLQYIEHLADCSGELNWVASPAERPKLIESASKVDAFIQTLDVTPDKDMMDFFDLNTPTPELVHPIRIFNDRFGHPITREGRLLFDALRQSMAVNMLLRKFGDLAREQLSQQAASIRAAQADADQTLQLQENLREAENQIKEEQALRSQLESAMKESPNEHIQRITQLEEELEAAHNALEESQNVSTQELTDAKASSIQIQADTTDLIRQQAEQIDRLRQELNEALEKLKDSEQNVLKERARADSNADKVEELRRKQAQLAAEANAALEAQKDQITDRYEKKMAAALSAEKDKRKEVKIRVSELENEKDKIQNELKNSQMQIDALNQFKKERLENERRLLTEQRNAELAAQETETRLRDNLRQAQTKLGALQSENTIISARLKAAVEKQKRDKEMYERQLSIHTYTAEAEYANKIESARKDAESEGRRVMLALCERFNDLADLSQPINAEVALSIIERIAGERAKYNAISAQLTETRKALNAPASSKLQAVAADTVRNLKEARAEVEALRSDYDNYKTTARAQRLAGGQNATEWEEWGRKIYIQLGGEGVPSRTTLRRRIEETIGVVGDSRKLMRKLDSLRKQKEILKDMAVQPPSVPISSLGSVIHALRFVRRVQRVTGHLPSKFNLNSSITNTDSTELSASFENSPRRKPKV